MNKKKFYKIARILLIIFTVCCFTVYLLAALNPYIHNERLWFISLSGIFFPMLLAMMIMLMIAWLFLNRQWTIVCGVILLLGWRSVFAIFPFPSFGDHDPGLGGGVITVMSYNVHELKPVRGGWDHGIEKFWKMILPVNPDILCLQEFNNSKKLHFMAAGNLDQTKKALGMPHAFFSRDFYYYDSLVAEGTVIFTRLPMLDSGKVQLLGNASSSVIYADLLAGDDTIRVMTTHLQSFQLEKNDYKDLARIKHLEAGMSSSLSRMISRFRTVILVQNEEALRLADIVRKSPYPVILCGDFNSAPNSFAYFTAKGDLEDSFIQKGHGIGATYSRLSNTLRIDYIFTDPCLKISSFEVKKILLSDHYPVVSKIVLPANTTD